MVVGLVDAVLEPAAAAIHGFKLIEVRGDDRAVAAMTVAVPPEKLENVHGHKEVVVIHDAAAAARAEPAGKLVAGGGRERGPELGGGDLEGDREQAHFDVMLVVAGVGPPVVRAGRIAAGDQAGAEPGGDALAESVILGAGGIVGGQGGALEVVGGEGEGAGEGFEAIGLGVVIAGRPRDGQLGAAGRHERGERVEQASSLALPMAVGGGCGIGGHGWGRVRTCG